MAGSTIAADFTPRASTDRPMDIIFIEELRAETWIGIIPVRKPSRRPSRFHCGSGYPRRLAGASDDIRDTVDYAVVVERLRADLKASHFNLLEKLTEHIATWLLENFAAQWVRVSVAKLGMMRGRQARRRHHRALESANPGLAGRAGQPAIGRIRESRSAPCAGRVPR